MLILKNLIYTHNQNHAFSIYLWQRNQQNLQGSGLSQDCFKWITAHKKLVQLRWRLSLSRNKWHSTVLKRQIILVSTYKLSSVMHLYSPLLISWAAAAKLEFAASSSSRLHLQQESMIYSIYSSTIVKFKRSHDHGSRQLAPILFRIHHKYIISSF